MSRRWIDDHRISGAECAGCGLRFDRIMDCVDHCFDAGCGPVSVVWERIRTEPEVMPLFDLDDPCPQLEGAAQ